MWGTVDLGQLHALGGRHGWPRIERSGGVPSWQPPASRRRHSGGGPPTRQDRRGAEAGKGSDCHRPQTPAWHERVGSWATLPGLKHDRNDTSSRIEGIQRGQMFIDGSARLPDCVPVAGEGQQACTPFTPATCLCKQARCCRDVGYLGVTHGDLRRLTILKVACNSVASPGRHPRGWRHDSHGSLTTGTRSFNPCIRCPPDACN